MPIEKSQMLGDPGIYVTDPQVAWQNWIELGHEGVINALVEKNEPLQGMAIPKVAALDLVKYMLKI